MPKGADFIIRLGGCSVVGRPKEELEIPPAWLVWCKSSGATGKRLPKVVIKVAWTAEEAKALAIADGYKVLAVAG